MNTEYKALCLDARCALGKLWGHAEIYGAQTSSAGRLFSQTREKAKR